MAQPLDLGVLLLDLDRGAVELDDEHRAGAVGVVAVHRRLGGLDRERVHHLDRRGHDAGRDDRRRGGTGVVGALEPDEEGAHLLGQPDQPDGHRGDDAERPLRADDGAEQVVAGAVGRGAAQRHRVAVGGDEVGADDVVGGEAVLQAVRAAGVLRDVAADRADLLARRVGRVVVAVGVAALVTSRLITPGLDDGALVLAAYGGDRAHLRGHDQHALGVRQGAAGQAGARSRGRRTARRARRTRARWRRAAAASSGMTTSAGVTR